MDIRQLQYFLTTCEHGSFLKAAEYAYVSQQALSKAIASLEKEIGLSLFTVGTRSLGGGYTEDYGSLKNLLVGFVTLTIALLWMIFVKGVSRSLAFLAGLIGGYILSVCLGMVDLADIWSGGFFTLPHFLIYEPVFRFGPILSLFVIYLVSATETIGDASALVTVLRDKYPDAIVGGAAVRQLDVQKSVGAEIPGIMLIAVAVVFAVLLLTSHAWLEPFLLLIVFALSILVNMGTNFIFPDISFITFAVCAILQLALSIDYAIMLLHTWNGFCDSGLPREEAMEKALEQSFMRIAKGS